MDYASRRWWESNRCAPVSRFNMTYILPPGPGCSLRVTHAEGRPPAFTIFAYKAGLSIQNHGVALGLISDLVAIRATAPALDRFADRLEPRAQVALPHDHLILKERVHSIRGVDFRRPGPLVVE